MTHSNEALDRHETDPRSAFQKAQDQRRADTYDALVQLGGSAATGDNAIKHGPGKAILLPADPTEMGYRDAAKMLQAAADAEEAEIDFNKTFKYRPWDGAAAVERVFQNVFGLNANLVTVMGMFGPVLPDRVTVATGVNTEIDVPWGKVDFPMIESYFFLGAEQDREFGMLFRIMVTAKKKHGPFIKGFFRAIEEELSRNSIYKGKAFSGIDTPKFFDPYAIRRDQVVYTREVENRLENAVWGPLRTADLQRAEGLALNTKNLLSGPYGTGKTLALTLTAQEAVQAGWTYIQAKATEDLNAVLKTAVLYSPAVVAIEDIDKLVKDDSNAEIAELLELFDGMTMKNNEVMVVMTSNNVGGLHKGMLRAGRIDAVIEIGSLDEDGVARLIKATVPDDKLDPDTDFAQVYKAMADYEPAFIRETFSSAMRAAVVRTGSRDYRLTTEDFVSAADTLRAQHNLHENKSDVPEVNVFEQAFRKVMEESLDSMLTGRPITDRDGDRLGEYGMVIAPRQ